MKIAGLFAERLPSAHLESLYDYLSSAYRYLFDGQEEQSVPPDA
jgi:hypothetical protein